MTKHNHAHLSPTPGTASQRTSQEGRTNGLIGGRPCSVVGPCCNGRDFHSACNSGACSCARVCSPCDNCFCGHIFCDGRDHGSFSGGQLFCEACRGPVDDAHAGPDPGRRYLHSQPVVR